jgi:uncharacterized protein (DUF433 family)
MAIETSYPHIEIRDNGMAYIAGTQIKVIEVVLDYLAWGLYPDQIQRQHPHLSLAQIHAAFTYYYDHKDDLDRLMAARDRLAQEFQDRQGESPVRAKLRAMGLIS